MANEQYKLLSHSHDGCATAFALVLRAGRKLGLMPHSTSLAKLSMVGVCQNDWTQLRHSSL